MRKNPVSERIPRFKEMPRNCYSGAMKVRATAFFFQKRYLFSIFETLDGGHDGPASPDGATPRDGLKVNSKAFRPEDAKQIQWIIFVLASL